MMKTGVIIHFSQPSGLLMKEKIGPDRHIQQKASIKTFLKSSKPWCTSFKNSNRTSSVENRITRVRFRCCTGTIQIKIRARRQIPPTTIYNTWKSTHILRESFLLSTTEKQPTEIVNKKASKNNYRTGSKTFICSNCI